MGAAPVIKQRKCSDSKVAKSGTWRMKLRMAGTEPPVVTRSSLIRAHTDMGSKLGMEMMVPPPMVQEISEVRAAT